MKQHQIWPWIAFIGVILLATLVRFHDIDAQSFWNDEGNSARLSERSIELIIEGTASDVHPPLYYLFLKGWQEFTGNSEFSLRSFSAFLGILLIPLTFKLGHELLGNIGPVVAVTAAFLAAINPALVYYSQEARMYQMLALWASLLSLLLLYVLTREERRMLYALAYIFVAAAGLYTHYFFPAVLIVHNLIFIIWLIRQGQQKSQATENRNMSFGFSRWKGQPYQRQLMMWFVMMVTISVLYLPWIPIYLRQVGGKAATRLPLPEFLLESTSWMAFGPTIGYQQVILPLFAYIVLLVAGLFLSRQNWRDNFSFSITMALSLSVPVIFMWLLGATRPAFFKFLLVAVPPLCLLAGAGWSLLWHGADRRPSSFIIASAAILLAGLILTGTGRSLANMTYEPQFWRADYRAMAAKIRDEAEPNAAIILNAANQWEVFTYYYHDGVPVIPFPVTYPDPKTVDKELTEITDQLDRIYVIFWGEAERDPNRLVERWLDDHAFKADTEWFGDVRFVTYAIASNDGGVLDQTEDIPVGDNINLRGYRLDATEIVPGDIIEVSLFWESSQPLEKRYKVFLHLLDEDKQIVTQRDSEPGGGLALTTTWQPGEIVRDNHGLLVPTGTPPGRYELVIGLYDFANPADRLLFRTIDGMKDNLKIADVEIHGGE